jgi:drug/metabolite transporter (DMT)-like permease
MLLKNSPAWVDLHLANLVRAAFIISAVGGGTAMFAIRQTIGDNGYQIYGAAFLRFSIACSIYLAAWASGFWGRPSLTWQQMRWLCTGGLASAGAHILLYDAAQTIAGGPLNAILALSPFLAGLLVWKTKIESISRRSLFFKAVCAVGVGVLTWDHHKQSGEMGTLTRVFGATALFTVCNWALKKQNAPVIVQGSIFFATASPVILVRLWMTGEPMTSWPPPVKQTLWLVYTILVVSGLSFTVYMWLLQKVKLVNAMSVGFIQPIVGLILDILWEVRAPALWTYVGVLIIAIGIALDGFLKDKAIRPLAPESPVSPNAVPVKARASILSGPERIG